MSAPKKRQINLLRKESFEETVLGHALNWALSAGRVIVILTEVVVIAAFLSRFWLDRTLTDLNEQNGILKAQVEAFTSFEEQFRSVQKKLLAYKKLEEGKQNFAPLILKTASLLPGGVSLSNISVSGKEITFDGISLTESGIAGFINALQKTPEFEEAALTRVSLQAGGSSLTFTAKAKIKKPENEPRN